MVSQIDGYFSLGPDENQCFKYYFSRQIGSPNRKCGAS